MHDGAGLEIANVVKRVVHELLLPDAAFMRFLKPFFEISNPRPIVSRQPTQWLSGAVIAAMAR
jgi:hypothetical protein